MLSLETVGSLPLSRPGGQLPGHRSRPGERGGEAGGEGLGGRRNSALTRIWGSNWNGAAAGAAGRLRMSPRDGRRVAAIDELA